MAEGAKTVAICQLLVPAHGPSLLDAGAVGALPNPLQPKRANTVLSTSEWQWKGQME